MSTRVERWPWLVSGCAEGQPAPTEAREWLVPLSDAAVLTYDSLPPVPRPGRGELYRAQRFALAPGAEVEILVASGTPPAAVQTSVASGLLDLVADVDRIAPRGPVDGSDASVSERAVTRFSEPQALTHEVLGRAYVAFDRHRDSGAGPALRAALIASGAFAEPVAVPRRRDTQ